MGNMGVLILYWAVSCSIYLRGIIGFCNLLLACGQKLQVNLSLFGAHDAVRHKGYEGIPAGNI